MKMKKLLPLLAVLLAACDNSTGVIGGDLMPAEDHVTTEYQQFTATSKSIKANAVIANTNDCYLGALIDPETRSKTTCDFLAQFHVMEDFKFPARNRIKTENGQVVADSADVRIYFDTYYGDSLTTMTLTLRELDANKIMEEGQTYYTDINPLDYVKEGGFSKTVNYTTKDLTKPATVSSSTTYYKNIPVKLPADFANRLLRSYYDDPNNYKNSYTFIHNVCPGFYFQHTGGVGAMVKAYVSAINLYFSYHPLNSDGTVRTDTLISTMTRMAATQEVIQNTHVEQSIPESMLDESNPYTYVKSPAGIFTEITLPVEEILAGTHYNDTINSVNISLRRYNDNILEGYHLNPPSKLILLKAAHKYDFFENVNVSDSTNYYTAEYNSTANAYTFSNIATIISWMKRHRDTLAGVTENDSQAAREQKWEAWKNSAAYDPEWNKVCLVPIQSETNTTSSSSSSYSYYYYSSSTSSTLSIRNDYGLSSVKLEGGPQGAIKVNVVYSRFENQ